MVDSSLYPPHGNRFNCSISDAASDNHENDSVCKYGKHLCVSCIWIENEIKYYNSMCNPIVLSMNKYTDLCISFPIWVFCLILSKAITKWRYEIAKKITASA